MHLPSWMKNPENKPFPPNYVNHDDYLQISADKIDGIRQIWKNKSDPDINTYVDYGVYSSSLEAQKALYYIAYNRSSRRMSGLGDLGYWIAWNNSDGGALYFIKWNYIFMVDSMVQAIEDAVVQNLLNKLNKL